MVCTSEMRWITDGKAQTRKTSDTDVGMKKQDREKQEEVQRDDGRSSTSWSDKKRVAHDVGDYCER